MPFAWAAGISAVASVGGAYLQGEATKSAQKSANDAQAAAEARARADLQPYNDAGQNGLASYGDAIGINGEMGNARASSGFTESPGYKWQLGEGLRAIDAGAASKGMLRSGATLKGELEYGQGLAKQDFGTYVNRLFDLSKLGENAAAKTGDQSVTTGQGIAGTDVSSGNQLSNIYGNSAAGLSKAAQSYAGNSRFDSLYGERTNALSDYGGGSSLGSYY